MVSVHQLDKDYFDRKAGRWLIAGVLLVIDSDPEPACGDLVMMLDGSLRNVADMTDHDAIGNGARVIGTMVPR